MKKILLLLLCVISFTTIHAKTTYTLSDDGTLTISGTSMPYNSYDGYVPWFNIDRERIKKVIIEDGVENIGYHAFSDFYKLTSITIPNSVTSIGYEAFFNCRSLTSITIPNSVTSIGDGAFWNCNSLTSITIPNSVTSMGVWVFMGCENLISAVIPNSVTSIGARAFYKCKSLKSFVIPNSITRIEDETFYLCESLTSIIIPSSVTSIGYEAFYGCENLTSITDLAKKRQELHSMFGYVNGGIVTLHVLPGCKAEYENWNYDYIERFNEKYFKVVEDATTSIDVVEGTPTISSDKIFSISGQQLNKIKKGVNIINGKKIIIK